MKKWLLYLFIIFFCFLNFPLNILALYDPLSVPNNRVGVHILEPSEIFQASLLVNSNGGEWGYVTIPMRSNDRDYAKWRSFFIACREFKIIPIIRIATYPNQNYWVTPEPTDILDFANFLDLMPWPIENRYVVLFNEPNHSKEWGNQLSPGTYVQLAKLANSIFKSASPDYFLLTAGLDMSAPNNHTSTDALTYIKQMFKFDPNWPDYFDGFSFHPYPNPAFSASPLTKNRYGIRSFEYELRLLNGYKTYPKLLFFTETGTLKSSNFYPLAFNNVWVEKRIVAITPFLLYAGGGDFAGFSLLNTDHSPTQNYRDIYNLTKIKGVPILATTSIPTQTINPSPSPSNSLPTAKIVPWIGKLLRIFQND